MIKRIPRHQLFLILSLLFFMQTRLNNIYAQDQQTRISDLQKLDSLIAADSLVNLNRENLEKIESPVNLGMPANIGTDSIASSFGLQREWKPDPVKATWLAIIFPGGGQIYNRKYWKLPLIYGGLVGCFYGLNWNNEMYTDYSKAYIDIMDNNPNTDSYLEILPPGFQNKYSQEYLKDLLRKRKDMYRRYRDMTVFALIGVCLISIVDAYVDAELSDFDISPDLSLRIAPTAIANKCLSGNSVGLQCSFTF
ncbi:hypothetical protein EZS27_011531 [termite gut metagenome]|uniref:DUF5683 domain-containing protein n=1 Tax=termite gut metagenome TaxID=433724 RepID=A0A5J4S3E1_9ZZZZ